jgi:hypothetical protein
LFIVILIIFLEKFPFRETSLSDETSFKGFCTTYVSVSRNKYLKSRNREKKQITAFTWKYNPKFLSATFSVTKVSLSGTVYSLWNLGKHEYSAVPRCPKQLICWQSQKEVSSRPFPLNNYLKNKRKKEEKKIKYFPD